MKNLTRITLGLLAAAFAGEAGVIVANGHLANRGVTQGVSLMPIAGSESVIEDQKGRRNSYLVRDYRGQADAADALYVASEDENFYVALAADHQSQDTTSGEGYRAGDFAVGRGDYGAGGAGGSFHPSNGVSAADLNAVSDWQDNRRNAPGHPSYPDPAYPNPVSGVGLPDLGGALPDIAELAYPAVDPAELGKDRHGRHKKRASRSPFPGTGQDAPACDNQLTENCTNSRAFVEPALQVPEPGSLALLSVAFFGMACLRRRIRIR